MKIYGLLVAALAAVATLATGAPAQAQQEVRLTARVPFEFGVGDTNLPRDTYQLSRMNGRPEVLLLRGDRTGAVVFTDEVRLPRADAPPSLLFHRYGDHYFLREIRWDETARLDLSETKAERDAAEGRAGHSAGRMETVIIVARR